MLKTPFTLTAATRPHALGEVVTAGSTARPQSAVIVLHGRGGQPAPLVSLVADTLALKSTLIVAPTAVGNVWYPERFTVLQSANEPELSSALSVIEALVIELENTYHVPRERIILCGFSQGACLVAEYLKQSSDRFAGAAIWSGGLIGTDEEVSLPPAHHHTLAGTPIYIGCDDHDAHIPWERVAATAALLTDLGGAVTLRQYQGLGHTIHPEGLAFVSNTLTAL